jgi:hypothetical protein
MATAINIKELRACLYGINMPVEGLRSYRVSEQQIAGVCGTEFCHPPYSDVPYIPTIPRPFAWFCKAA